MPSTHRTVHEKRKVQPSRAAEGACTTAGVGLAVTRLLLATAMLTCASCDTTSDELDAAAIDATSPGQLADAGAEGGPPSAEKDPFGCFGIPSGDSDPRRDDDDDASLPEPPIDRDEDCGGADLYVAFLGGCSACSGVSATVIVANRGTRAASYRLESNAETLDIDAPLDPQTGSEPHVLELRPPSSTVRVTANGAGDDCNPANDVRKIDVAFITCE